MGKRLGVRIMKQDDGLFTLSYTGSVGGQRARASQGDIRLEDVTSAVLSLEAAVQAKVAERTARMTKTKALELGQTG